MQMFDATSGGSWKDSTGWGSSSPLNKWHGISLDNEGQVVKLDLRENNLAGASDFHTICRKENCDAQVAVSRAYVIACGFAQEWGSACVQ